MSATFTPVVQARASGEIVSQIERAMFAGELSPGDRLQSERELAEQFSVSRITVRDALRNLEARGLIRVRVGASGGAFVADSTSDRVAESISTMIRLRRMTLSEIAEARKVVEAATAALAAQRATPTDVAALAAVVERGKGAVRQHESHLDVSMEFHVALARAAGNEVLYETVRAYHQLVREALGAMHEYSAAKATLRHHEALLDAVRSHDPEGARESMIEHMEEFEKRLRAYVRAQRKERPAPRARAARG